MLPRSIAVHTLNMTILSNGLCNVSMARGRYPYQGSIIFPFATCWTSQCQIAAPWKEMRAEMLQWHKSHPVTSHQRPQSLRSNRTSQRKVFSRASGSAFDSGRFQPMGSSRGPAEPSGITADQSSASSLGSQDSSASAGAPVQFEIHRIAGDGSCLFRAIAQGAHHVSTGSLLSRRGLFEAGFDLRREVCAEMVRRREDIEPFIPGVFDAYVSNMSLEGIWGGEPELAVAIHCVQRPIIVYREVKSGLLGKDLEKVSEYGAEQYPGVSPVCLLFSGFHYDLLMQVVQ